MKPEDETSLMYFNEMGVLTKVADPITLICLPIEEDKSIYAIHYKSKSGSYSLR